MTPQERQVLADLFERIRSAAADPRDAEAEAFIAEAVRAQPYAPYVLAQTALVQQHALDAAAQRIQELEAQGRAAGRRRPVSSAISAARCSAAASRRRGPAYDASAYQRATPPRRRAAPAYARRRPARGARRPPRRAAASSPAR